MIKSVLTDICSPIIGSYFNVHYRVMVQAGSLESMEKAQDLLQAIAKSNSSFSSALQTSHLVSLFHEMAILFCMKYDLVILFFGEM